MGVTAKACWDVGSIVTTEEVCGKLPKHVRETPGREAYGQEYYISPREQKSHKCGQPGMPRGVTTGPAELIIRPAMAKIDYVWLATMQPQELCWGGACGRPYFKLRGSWPVNP